METMDADQVKRVWSRVFAQPDAQNGQTAASDSTSKPESDRFAPKILAAICAQQDDRMLYRYLMRRLCPSAIACLKELIAHTECRIKTLGAVYYLETDRKACCEYEKPVCAACANEALRQQYARVSAQETAYRALGAEKEDYECQLQQMAGLLCCDKKLILEILKENL